MKKSEWQKIVNAAKLLGLGESATLAQIKKAYRRMSKKCHPDLEGQQETAPLTDMAAVNEAYQILLQYCLNYSFPLSAKDNAQPLDVEDWWMERFGQDPLWGKKKR